MADVLGYCMGVRKAMEKAVDAASLNPGKKIYSAGPLIHNPNALKKLENLGIGILKTDTELENSIVIIRAHGIPPEEKKRLSCSGAELVDATCPRVLSSQRLAEKYYKEGYQVFLAGDKNHGEIEGLAGFAPGCIVLENPGDAENLNQIPEKSVLIGQTTIKDDEYQAIAGKLKFKNPGIIICNTLCPAAGKRQAALADLAQKVEGIIVVGGRNSANTKRLFYSASALVKKAWHIENPEEIPPEVFELDKVGITAGASTPDEDIEKVMEYLGSGIKGLHCQNHD